MFFNIFYYYYDIFDIFIIAYIQILVCILYLVTNSFNYMCYIRYIAMSAVGGGWMSDYDVLPLRFYFNGLPNNGAFTVYETSVPSLVSGNESEWERLMNEIIDEGNSHIYL